MYIVHTVQYIRETDRQKATQRLRDRQTEMDSPKRDRQTATQRLRDRQTATQRLRDRQKKMDSPKPESIVPNKELNWQ